MQLEVVKVNMRNENYTVYISEICDFSGRHNGCEVSSRP